MNTALLKDSDVLPHRHVMRVGPLQFDMQRV